MLKKIFLYRSMNVFLALCGLILLFALFSPNFAFTSAGNIEVFLALAPEFGIIALGVGMLMICGEFDLSIGSILVFSSFIFVKFSEVGVNLFLAGVITLGVGALLGLLNGLITVKGRIPSFITTLGTMMLWRGILYVYSGMAPIAIRPYLPEGSSSFVHIFTGEILGTLPVQIVWFGAIATFLGLLLHFHRFGNWIYSTGDNKEAARAMGINTDMVKTVCFIIVGVLCAFVAMMQALRLGSFAATQGIGFELKAIAASVVGGTSLMGGIGSMVGIVCGTLIIVVIENALTSLRIPYSWTYVVFGLVILSSVLFDMYLERRRLRYGSVFFKASQKGTPGE